MERTQAPGEYVQFRRLELGMRSKRDLAEAATVSPRTVARIEKGEAVGTSVERLIEHALGWQYYSLDRIRAGEKPLPLSEDENTVTREPPGSVDGDTWPTRAQAAMLLAVWQDEGHDALRIERQRLRKQLDTETMRSVMHEFTQMVAEASK